MQQPLGVGARNIPQELTSTPPRSIYSVTGSAVSSLTNDTNANIAPAVAPATPVADAGVVARKRTAEHLSPGETPSPKKPDFSRPLSDGISLMSGDDEKKWEKEEADVMALIEQMKMLEDKAADEMEDNVETTYEWEGFVDPDPIANEEEELKYNVVEVTLSRDFTGDYLKAICTEQNLSKTGNKSVLFERIRDSGLPLIKKVSDLMFEYKKVIRAEGNVPKWVVLCGKPVDDIEGIDIQTGAQHGYYGPTNKENAIGPTKLEYLTDRCVCEDSERIKRPTFARKPSRTKTNVPPPSATASAPSTTGTTPPELPSDCGGPSKLAKEKIRDLKTARPIDFFNLQISRKFVKACMVETTNKRAASEGAGPGGTKYPDYVPFDVPEMYKHIGLLFANGLSPKPSIDLWFVKGVEHRLWGNDSFATAMDKRLPNGKTVKGYQRWKHFRAYFALYDFRVNIKEQTIKNPLWKIQTLLDELNHNARKMWTTGKWVSIDEQTLGFKGRHRMKLRISYKREGDGFQCDAVCDMGYTFSFYFRHGDSPILPEKYKHLDLSPTARRVVWLATRLSNDWTSIFMDNLFNSQKLFTALYIAKALGHGVARSNGRGICPEVLQTEEKNKKKAGALRGTTKAARLVNSPACPDLLSVSVYDTKPVLLLSTVSEDIRWIEKKRCVWSDTQRK